MSLRMVKWLTPKSLATSPMPRNMSAIAANSCSGISLFCRFSA
jgi:hypothetical protein